MSLAVESRFCGTVFVLRCAGRILSGPESQILSDALERGLLESTRAVINLAEIDRIDSSGMGLLVRFLWRTRNRKGEIRLAAPSAFVNRLLDSTRLSTVFAIYPDEEAAIVSFLKEGTIIPSEQNSNTGPRVLFLDPSPDTCAFVRAVLGRHGYRVLSTGLMGDAKILLSASTVDVLMLGPESGSLSAPATLEVLRKHAPRAKTVVLDPEFKNRSADEAGVALLDRIRTEV